MQPCSWGPHRASAFCSLLIVLFTLDPGPAANAPDEERTSGCTATTCLVRKDLVRTQRCIDYCSAYCAGLLLPRHAPADEAQLPCTLLLHSCPPLHPPLLPAGGCRQCG